jgi:ubiquinone/menaquinone biosynthesis C-methylase UbiE
MSEKTKVLDLGRGKGAVSVNLAKAFGCRVKGIDMILEFIDYSIERLKNMLGKDCVSLLEGYIQSQQAECDELEGEITGVTWLLQVI